QAACRYISKAAAEFSRCADGSRIHPRIFRNRLVRVNGSSQNAGRDRAEGEPKRARSYQSAGTATEIRDARRFPARDVAGRNRRVYSRPAKFMVADCEENASHAMKFDNERRAHRVAPEEERGTGKAHRPAGRPLTGQPLPSAAA